MILNHESCCGVREIHHLDHYWDPAPAIKEFGKHTYGLSPEQVRTMPVNRWGYRQNNYGHANRRFRYAIFTQATKRAVYGKRFAAYIKEHKLGEVICTGFNSNPNTRRLVQVWVWTVDHDALKTHLNVTW